MKTVYDHIQSNNAKVCILITLFPISLIVLYCLITCVLGMPINVIKETLTVGGPIIGAITLGWMAISWKCGDKMMMQFAGAIEVQKDTPQNKAIYRLVENTALAGGLPTPKVFIIEDNSLNAFATGRDPRSASIALTRGIINKLTTRELQGVIAHELAHIGNRDIRLNMLIITGLGVFGLLGELCFRLNHFSSRDNKNAHAMMLVIGFTCLVFHWFVAPIIQMAISRTKEHLADATAAYITRNPQALADALKKISEDAVVEKLENSPNMAGVCIYSPLTAPKLTGLFATHPPVEERIARLESLSSTISAQG